MHEIIKQVKTNISMETLLMKTGSDIKLIRLAKVLSISYRESYLAFDLENDFQLVEGNFNDTLSILPNHFILINRNTIINSNFVKKIEPLRMNIILKDKSIYRFSVTKIHLVIKMYACFCLPIIYKYVKNLSK